MLEIHLVRHGETEENLRRVLQGRMPGHLTQRGICQAETLRDELVASSIHFEALVCSPLERAQATARIINARLGLPFHTEPDLAEREWGSITGIQLEPGRKVDIPADAETDGQMYARARRVLNHLFVLYPDACVLVVAHGLFNRALLAVSQGCAIRDVLSMKNAEVRVIRMQRLLRTDEDGCHQQEGVDVVSAN